jgi:arabinogalactan oligomer / maltooligosaccharide transport system permease protein
MFDAQFGMINQIWQLFGGPENFEWFQADVQPIPFWPPLPRAFYAILLTNVWLGWPFMMTVATGALQSIPGDLYEAAAIDGASAWQKFWTVTAPLLRPAMVPAIIIGITMTFNQFNVVYFISQGAPFGKTEILVTQAYKLINPGGQYGRAAAFSFIIFGVLAVITLVTNRISKATESYDA